MKKYYSYIIIIMSLILLLPIKTKAATTRVITSWTSSAGTFTVGTQSYTGIQPTYTGINSETDDYHGTYEITHSIDLVIPTGVYLNGAVVIQISTAIGSGEGTLVQNTLKYDPIEHEGLHTYLYEYTPGQYRIAIIFDNCKPNSGFISIGTVTTTYNVTVSSPNNTSLERNFTTTISKVAGGSIEGSEGVINNRFTALLYNAIMQGVGIDVQNAVTLLEQIRANDLTYYSQIVSQLNTIISNQNLTYNEIVTIFNEIDTDFAAVQTVLDLFPSYRTQVLKYWQELLTMNSAQSSAAAEVESQYSHNENTSNNLLSGMGSVTMPSISSGDINILGNVDATQKTNFFGMLGTITNTNLITTILLIIVTAAIAGYILFGKK